MPEQQQSVHLLKVDPNTKRDRSLAYYEYVSSGTAPFISVIQDVDESPGFGAFWGEVNSNIHNALGVIGVVTNGSVRDLDVLSAGFQVLAGKIGPAHAYVRIEETGIPVNIFGMNVQHNDLTTWLRSHTSRTCGRTSDSDRSHDS